MALAEIDTTWPAQCKLGTHPNGELKRNRDDLCRRVKAIFDEFDREQGHPRSLPADPQPRVFPGGPPPASPQHRVRG